MSAIGASHHERAFEVEKKAVALAVLLQQARHSVLVVAPNVPGYFDIDTMDAKPILLVDGRIELLETATNWKDRPERKRNVIAHLSLDRAEFDEASIKSSRS